MAVQEPEHVIAYRQGDRGDLPRVRPLWEALYVQQQQQGMLLPVPPDAFVHWSKSIEPVLARFGCLVLAEAGPDLVGFVAGRTRSVPAYFGGGQAGFISDVFVVADRRGSGVGKRMLEEAASWFRLQGVRRLELQVIMGNTGAREAYRRLHWKEELVQMALDLRDE